jgi:hypothetical protein
VIRIIKKTPGVAPPIAAPVVAPVVPTAAPPAAVVPNGGLRIPIKPKAPPKPISGNQPTHYSDLTDAERIKRWGGVPPPGAKAKECDHCKQWYIKPCNAAQSQECMNGKHYRSLPQK